MIKKYNNFIVKKSLIELTPLLEGILYGSTDFVFKLKALTKVKEGNVAEIAKAILEILEDEYSISDKVSKQNYFNLTDKDDMISFLPDKKMPDNWDPDEDASLPYYTKGRGEIKIGKIVHSLIPSIINISSSLDAVTAKDVEDFVNHFKASKPNKNIEFKIVGGDDIEKYYNIKNYYSENGSLGGSCMASKSKSFFKLYSKNPKKIYLLLYIDDKNKIHGRALIWKLNTSPCDAKWFMDRVYVNRDSDEIKFKKFAEEKGFLYKKKMSAEVATNVNFIYKGEPVNGEVSVKIDGKFNTYPFLDTLCFLDEEKEHLSNLPTPGCYSLQSMWGELESCSFCGGTVIRCGDCYDDGKIDCPKCYGYGKDDDGKECSNCKGKGKNKCKHPDAELCHYCADGIRQLEELGIKTDKNLENFKSWKKKK